MGQTSKKLHRKLKTMAASLGPVIGGRENRLDMPSIEERLDPVHAVFTFVQYITSYFAERVSQFPEMEVYAIPDL